MNEQQKDMVVKFRIGLIDAQKNRREVADSMDYATAVEMCMDDMCIVGENYGKPGEWVEYIESSAEAFRIAQQGK